MTTGILLSQFLTQWTQTAILNIIGFALFAGAVAVGAAFVYRGTTTFEMPVGVGVILGAGVIALWLNITAIDAGPFIRETPLVDPSSGYYLAGVFLGATVLAEGGRRIGDYLACDVYSIERINSSGEAADVVRAGGVAITVRLPETIDDLEGYPPVDEAVKRRLAGKEMLFPRRLSIDELADRLERRIEDDFAVGHASVELTSDGTIDAIAVGSEATGIGPSLPPDSLAVAVRGDAVGQTSLGDSVEVWETEEQRQLVATGRIRSTAGEITTLVISDAERDAFDAETRYKLTTRPEVPNEVDAFVSVVSATEETIMRCSVDAGGPFEGEFVSWLPVTVMVVEREGEVIVFPDDNLTLQATDTLYVFGGPADLQALATYETASTDEQPSTLRRVLEH